MAGRPDVKASDGRANVELLGLIRPRLAETLLTTGRSEAATTRVLTETGQRANQRLVLELLFADVTWRSYVHPERPASCYSIIIRCHAALQSKTLHGGSSGEVAIHHRLGLGSGFSQTGHRSNTNRGGNASCLGF